MSKRKAEPAKSAVDEEDAEPPREYVEPSYKEGSNLGQENSKSLNEAALLQMANAAKNKKKQKWEKKNRYQIVDFSGENEVDNEAQPQDTKVSSEKKDGEQKNRKKKTQIILDADDLEEITSQTRPSAQGSNANTGQEARKGMVLINSPNTAILATVGPNIEENDLKKIFSDIQIKSINPFTGYYIIDFMSKEELDKALKKNKTTYKNNTTILIGHYSIEDENPPPKYSDKSHDSGHSERHSTTFLLGSNQAPSNPPRTHAHEKGNSGGGLYQQSRNFLFGEKQQVNAQPIPFPGSNTKQQPNPPTKRPYQGKKYEPPNIANKNQPTKIETKNKFDMLNNSDSDDE